MDYKEDWQWAFDVCESDEKLGRLTTADDLGPFNPEQKSARQEAVKAAGDDPAVAAVFAQVPLLEDLLGIKLHVDHIVPIARGGQHTASNLQIIPAKVNLLKSDRTDVRYEDLV